MPALAFALLLLAAPASAGTIVIDFEGEAVGERGSSFVTADGSVRLSEWRGGELAISLAFGSNALQVGEEGGALVIDFLVPVHTIFLDFGNDVPGLPEGDQGAAILIAMRGGAVVGFDTATANQNRLIDQTLAISGGGLIESAFFAFRQAGEFEPISPFVDRLTMVTVPEPGTLALGALALLAVTAGRRRRAYPSTHPRSVSSSPRGRR